MPSPGAFLQDAGASGESQKRAQTRISFVFPQPKPLRAARGLRGKGIGVCAALPFFHPKSVGNAGVSQLLSTAWENWFWGMIWGKMVWGMIFRAVLGMESGGKRWGQALFKEYGAEDDGGKHLLYQKAKFCRKGGPRVDFSLKT